MKKLLYWLSGTDKSLVEQLPSSARITRGSLGLLVMIHVVVTLGVWGKTFYSWFGIKAVPAAVLVTLLMLTLDRLIISTPISIEEDPDIDYRGDKQIRKVVRKRVFLGLFFAAVTGLTFALDISSDSIRNLLMEDLNQKRELQTTRYQEGKAEQIKSVEATLAEYQKALSTERELKAKISEAVEGRKTNLINRNREIAGDLGNGYGYGAQARKYDDIAESFAKAEKAYREMQMAPDLLAKLNADVRELTTELAELKRTPTDADLKAQSMLVPQMEEDITSKLKGFVLLLRQDIATSFLILALFSCMVAVELAVILGHSIASATPGEKLYSSKLLFQTRLNAYQQWECFEDQTAGFHV